MHTHTTYITLTAIQISWPKQRNIQHEPNESVESLDMLVYI